MTVTPASATSDEPPGGRGPAPPPSPAARPGGRAGAAPGGGLRPARGAARPCIAGGSARDAGEPRLERGTALWRCRRPTGVRRGSAGDLAGLQAAGADVQPLGRTVDGGPHPLDVRVEATLRD